MSVKGKALIIIMKDVFPQQPFISVEINLVAFT